MKVFRLLAFLLVWGGLVVANGIFNGSFELGTVGFALENELRPDTNPQLTFHPLQVVPGAPGCGRQALRLDNPHAEYYCLFSKEFQLKPATRYRFSVKVRGTHPDDQVFFGVFKVDPAWSAHARTFKVTPEWKRCEWVFTTADKAGWYHLLIRPGNKSVQANTLTFDDVRLEEIGNRAVNLTEATAQPDRHLYRRGEQARVKLNMTNPGTELYAGTVTVTGQDEVSGKICFEERVQVELAPGETKTMDVKPWTLQRYAGIRISVTGEKLKTHDAFFTVIGPYQARPFDIHREMVVAFNGGLNYRIPAMAVKPSYRVCNAPLTRQLDLLAQLGCRILRDHDAGVRGVDWTSVEGERGQFDFSHLDRQLALYEAHGIVLFPVIGNGCIESRSSHKLGWPSWVNPLCHRVTKHPPNCMRGVRGRILLPPLDLYRNYLSQTVGHIRGRVPVYEFMNEPNLYLASDVYVRYLQAAHEAIRAQDPQASIAGFCLTSDFEAVSAQWMRDCARLGGLKKVDAVGFHPYRGRELGSAIGADHYIDNLRRQMRECGYPDMPLWNTELYYLIDQRVAHDSYSVTQCQPHHVIWRFLVDLGEGVTQSIAIPADYLWKRLLTPNMLHTRNYHEMIPSELFVAYNALARLFEGAKPVAKFRHENGIVCYVFRKDGKLIAAAWNYQKRKGIYGDFSPFRVMDLFGNEEPAGETLLENAPYYLTMRQGTETEFLRQLKTLDIRLARPISAGQLGRRLGNVLHVTLHNDSGQEQRGTVSLTGNGMDTMTPVDFVLPPRSEKPVALSLQRGNAEAKTAELKVNMGTNAYALPLEIIRHKTLGRNVTMHNAKGTVQFGQDGITVTMSVRDSTDAGPSGTRKPWETDCTELFFDLEPLIIPQNHAQTYTSQVFRLFVTPRDKVRLHAMGRIRPQDCKLTLTQSKEGYSFVLTIPVKTGNYLGFDVKIDDWDGRNLHEWTLGGGTRLHDHRCNFSLLK